jgi:cell division protein FtsZ
MAIALTAPKTTELKPRIVVFGVGGAGGNAVNNMIEAGLEGVEFVVANTDAQQLQFAKTDRRIQLGETRSRKASAPAPTLKSA